MVGDKEVSREITNHNLLKCLMEFKKEVMENMNQAREESKDLKEKINGIDNKIEKMKLEK